MDLNKLGSIGKRLTSETPAYHNKVFKIAAVVGVVAGAIITGGAAAGIPASVIAWAKIVAAISGGVAVQAKTAVK